MVNDDSQITNTSLITTRHDYMVAAMCITKIQLIISKRMPPGEDIGGLASIYDILEDEFIKANNKANNEKTIWQKIKGFLGGAEQ